MKEGKKMPYSVDCVPGNYAWCTCGQSKNLPHCDGSHVGTEHKPHIHMVGKDVTVHICSCGKSANRPYCDGAHNNE